MKQIKASIITIGDELLIGQTIDTNSAFISQELNKIGVWVRRRIAVGDVYDDIWQTLDEETANSDIIIITGGLGPTADDITKPVLCNYFGGKLVVNQEVLDHIKNLFEKIFRRPGPILERNLKQAEVPDVCAVLFNERGSAPGMLFKNEKGVVVISLPGVPHEMKGLMTKSVIPYIESRFELPVIVHCTAFTAGQGESFIAELLKDFEPTLPPYIKLAYLPNYGMVKLRLTTTGADRVVVESELEPYFIKLQELVKEWLVANEDIPLEKVIGKILREKNKTVGTAESCTGGYIAHLITTIPGASKYYKGSVIAYSNQVKEDILDVDSETLTFRGAVSEQTVKEMVTGALSKLKADYVVATSGIMGPDGGTQTKQVGTVWIAVGNKDKIETLRLHLRFDRERNIMMTAGNAMNLLRRFILSN